MNSKLVRYYAHSGLREPVKGRFQVVTALRKGWGFLIENSLFLVMGAIAALIFANSSYSKEYQHIVHEMHFAINEVLMAFFFAMAAKEIRESTLPGGALSNLRTAALPLLATVGGMMGPAVLYATGAGVLNADLMGGWAIPTATDIAFSYLVGRFIFGKGHPAIAFLLLLAVADDGGGLGILAVFYPVGEPNYMVFAASVVFAMVIGWWMNRNLRITAWGWYLLPGALSWYGFHEGGIHPALALVPIIWTMPHEHDDRGLFAGDEDEKSDTLNNMSSWLKHPVELVLGLFGFCSAGVALSSLDTGTWLVSAGLLIGKPLGITLFTLFGIALGLKLPVGMTKRDVLVLGSVAGIGFTVALFVSGVAFPEPGLIQDSVKMGALLSFLSAPISIALAYFLKVGRWSKNQPQIAQEINKDAAK